MILQYERIDASEGIDINQPNESKECMICHYWYFLDIGYEYVSICLMDAMISQ